MCEMSAIVQLFEHSLALPFFEIGMKTDHFAFLCFFFLGMVLITTSCTMSQTSVHSSSGFLSIKSHPLNPFVISMV